MKAIDILESKDYLNQILEVRNFLPEGEVEELLNSARKQQFKKSTVTSQSAKEVSKEDIPYQEKESENRTSSTSYYSQWDNLFFQKSELVRKRVSRLLNVDISRLEQFQLTKYEEGQKFSSHLDCGLWGSNERLYSVIIYLNECLGGGTRFANIGKSISPEPGKLVIWRNLSPENTCWDRMRHSGEPVESGEKYILVTWVRLKPLNISTKIVKSRQERLSESFTEIDKYYSYEDFNSEQFKGFLSSVYSVCTCKISELNMTKPTKRRVSSYTWTSKEQILSLHLIVLSGNSDIEFDSGQRLKVNEGDVLSIYNLNDNPSFNSSFKFINLDKIIVKVFAIHLNKVN